MLMQLKVFYCSGCSRLLYVPLKVLNDYQDNKANKKPGTPGTQCPYCLEKLTMFSGEHIIDIVF